MSDLNKIEYALKRRAEKELKDVVNRFTKELEVVGDKYRIGVSGSYVVKAAGSDFKTYVDLSGLNFMLHETLKDRFLDRMVSIKSEELLRKVDLYE
jgi:hypothetical protein